MDPDLSVQFVAAAYCICHISQNEGTATVSKSPHFASHHMESKFICCECHRLSPGHGLLFRHTSPPAATAAFSRGGGAEWRSWRPSCGSSLYMDNISQSRPKRSVSKRTGTDSWVVKLLFGGLAHFAYVFVHHRFWPTGSSTKCAQSYSMETTR